MSKTRRASLLWRSWPRLFAAGGPDFQTPGCAEIGWERAGDAILDWIHQNACGRWRHPEPGV